MQNKGFTLIELLVVIAIIGILAGIIVVSMGGAQNSAKNAKIKATMDQMRSAAELNKIKTNAEDYSAMGTDVANLITAINDVTAAAPDAVSVTPTTFAKWCYSAELLGDGAGSWCVDSNGNAGVPTASNTCSTTYSCK